MCMYACISMQDSCKTKGGLGACSSRKLDALRLIASEAILEQKQSRGCYMATDILRSYKLDALLTYFQYSLNTISLSVTPPAVLPTVVLSFVMEI